MLYFMIYLLHIVDMMTLIATVATGITLIIIFLVKCVTIGADQEQPDIKQANKIMKIAIPIAILSILTLIIIPPKDTLYQIYAIYFGKQVNSQIKINEKIKKFQLLLIFN